METGLTGCLGALAQVWVEAVANGPEAGAATGQSHLSEAMCALVLQVKSRTATHHPVQVRNTNISISKRQMNPYF